MSNNNANKTETMAQRQDRLFATLTMIEAIEAVIVDWKSGDMTLSRMESVMGFNLHWIGQSTDFRKHIGKLERVGRLGKTPNAIGCHMGRVTPNEITQYLQECVNFLRETGRMRVTAIEFAAETNPVKFAL